MEPGSVLTCPPLPLPPLPDPHRAVRACGATPGYKLTDRHGSTPRDPGVESTVTTLPGVNLAGPGAYGSHAGCSCGNTPTALFCLGAGLHPTGRAGGLPEGDVIIKDVRVRNVKTGFARREPGISSPGNHRKDTWWQRPHHSSASDVCTTTGLPEAPLHPAIAGGCRYRLPEPGVFCFDRPDPGAPEAAGTLKKKGGGEEGVQVYSRFHHLTFCQCPLMRSVMRFCRTDSGCRIGLPAILYGSGDALTAYCIVTCDLYRLTFDGFNLWADPGDPLVPGIVRDVPGPILCPEAVPVPPSQISATWKIECPLLEKHRNSRTSWRYLIPCFA